MSDEQLKGFLEAVAADAELQEKLKAATDVEAVVAIAEAAGFVVSAEELEALVLQAQSEISEEELQGVAGGEYVTDIAKGVAVVGGVGIIGSLVGITWCIK